MANFFNQTGNLDLNITLPTMGASLRALLALSLLIMLPFSASALAAGKSTFLAADTEDSILAPDQAFKLVVSRQDAQTLRADFQIAPGHYLYRERFKFAINRADSNLVRSVELPAGELKQDPTFGQTEVYHNAVTAIIRLAEARQSVDLSVTYQGCSEKGLCYAPITKQFTVAATGAGGSSASAAAGGPANNDQAAALLENGKLWLIIAGFFGFGLLLSLTPCVLPMIPILSSIIVGSKSSGRAHSFNLSLAYTLGMALTYTLIGVAAGLSGQLISIALQNAWVLSAAALVLILLALSMFGFYELRLPGALEERMVNVTNRIQGGRLLGVFVMGALSALIMSPCVAAPLAGALLYISQTHDVLLGGVALFALAIGMGVPLLLIGASAGTLLPKVGPWMVAVRNFFGVLLLALALWLISPLLPAALVMALWAVLLIMPAIYMHALDSLPAYASRWKRFWKGIAVIMLIIGVALLIGALAGAKSPWQPLAGWQAAGISTEKNSLPFMRVNNLAELEQQIQRAAGRTVMLDFYADWCVACKEYEHYTFSDPRVQQRLQNTVLLQADVTRNSADDKALMQRFALFGPPGIIFFDREGREIRHMKVIGYQKADEFLNTLDQLQL